jgi:hypothetical protein
MVLRHIAAGTLAVVAAAGAGAYESDFHYGMTYWLAAQAQFDPLQSHDLARGNERTDTGMLDAKHAIIYELCILRNETASELTRELHFRAQRRAPAAPPLRVVSDKPGFAPAAVKAVMNENNVEERDQLIRFGRALHGWQDTFSHAGEPSEVPICPADWTWAHPKTQDGKNNALSHAPDQTFTKPAACLEAARTTYEYLLEYRRVHHLPVDKAPGWPRLTPRAEVFCKADTKTDKAKWLGDEGVPQPRAIAKNTTLPDGKYNLRRVAQMALGETAPKDAGPMVDYEVQSRNARPDPEIDRRLQQVFGAMPVSAPTEATNWAEVLIRTWLTAPVQQLDAAMVPFGVPGAGTELLARLRIADRGLADSIVGTALIGVLSNPENVVTGTADTWRSLLVPVRGREAVALVASPATDASFIVVVVVLRHAPQDALLITAGRSGDSYRVKSIDAFVFH